MHLPLNPFFHQSQRYCELQCTLASCVRMILNKLEVHHFKFVVAVDFMLIMIYVPLKRDFITFSVEVAVKEFN